MDMMQLLSLIGHLIFFVTRFLPWHRPGQLLREQHALQTRVPIQGELVNAVGRVSGGTVNIFVRSHDRLVFDGSLPIVYHALQVENWGGVTNGDSGGLVTAGTNQVSGIILGGNRNNFYVSRADRILIRFGLRLW